MIEKIRKPELEHGNAPAPGSVEEYNANHLSASAGHPLHMPDELRARLESRTGVDLGNVQLRESGQPESIGARAFTRGNVIDFAPGEFQPGTQEGEALIGHEVSHVLQQAGGQVRADSGASPVNADPSLERAADEGVQGGMESVPSMSYSASPVQGAFGLNHFRKWRADRAAKKQAAHVAALAAQLNQRKSMADDMASTAADTRWQRLMDEEMNEIRGYIDLWPTQFGDDEMDDAPLAAAGSAAATAQLAGGGGQTADDVDFAGLLPMAPRRRSWLGSHR